ncbi:MAG: sugar phosphate nucleotidyltransferase [Thermoanaerobaculia bacterium]
MSKKSIPRSGRSAAVAAPADDRTRLWAVVLAGGQGRRLEPLTRALYGTGIPKQFAVLSGDRSLLQTTIERIAPLVPFERILVVICKTHEDTARQQLARYPGVELVIQPRNLDTAVGILLPLARVLTRDPAARAAIFPSDHHVSRPEAFLEAAHGAASLAQREPARLVLLGAVPDTAETEYGWILPGPALSWADPRAARAVSWFVEKPSAPVAQRLFERGALWNTFASVGRVAAYWELAKRHLPSHAAEFEAYVAAAASRGGADEMLERLYARMAPANFSRAILERAGGLAVLPVAGSGWCDWGSPRRVFQSLGAGGGFRTLVTRFRADSETAHRWGPGAERTHVLRNPLLLDFPSQEDPNERSPSNEERGLDA